MLEKLRGTFGKLKISKHEDKNDSAWQAQLKKLFLEIVNAENENQRIILKDEYESQNTFMDLVADANPIALERIITFLSTIGKRVKKSRLDEERFEKNSLISFNRFKQNIENEIKKCEDFCSRLANNNLKYKKKFDELKMIVDLKEENIKQKKVELDTYKLLEKQHKEKQSQNDSNLRMKEKDVVSKVNEIVKDKLSNISKYMYIRNSVPQNSNSMK